MPTDDRGEGTQRLRLAQVVLVLSTVGFSWYAMMAVHEAGHVLNAVLSGGAVARVVVPLLGFSRTDLSLNPHPLFVVWGGPLWGCILPMLLWGLLAVFRSRCAFLARFFAGFCLIVNGVYIGAGSIWRVADAGDMVARGSPVWLLIAFGAAAVVLGGALWNRLGSRFGLGQARGEVDGRAAILMAVAFAAVVTVVAAFG